MKKITRKISQRITRLDEMIVQFDITNTCNLSCKHCYLSHHDNNGNLSFQEWIDVFKQVENLLEKLGLNPYFLICGGEPLASPHLWSFIAEIRKVYNESKIVILSNGTLISEKVTLLAKQFQVEFQISFDGFNAVTHDEYRGKGQFEKTLRGLSILQKENIFPMASTTLSLRTQYWIEEFFSFAHIYKLSQINFCRFIGKGFGQQLIQAEKDRALKAEELKLAYETIDHCVQRWQIPSNLNRPLGCLISPQYANHNMMGFQGIIIDFQGNLKVSSRSGYKLGNVLVDGLEKLFLHHPLLERFRNFSIESCRGCEHERVCSGSRDASYVEHGDFFAADPGCWYRK